MRIAMIGGNFLGNQQLPSNFSLIANTNVQMSSSSTPGR